MTKPLPDLNVSTITEQAGHLTLRDFAALFCVDVTAIPADLRRQIKEGDFRYAVLDGEARDRTLLDVLRTIDSGTLSPAGAEGKNRWDKGWTENLDAFVASGYDLEALIPKYIRPR